MSKQLNDKQTSFQSMLDAMKDAKNKVQNAEKLTAHQCEYSNQLKECQKKLFDLTDRHVKISQ